MTFLEGSGPNGVKQHPIQWGVILTLLGAILTGVWWTSGLTKDVEELQRLIDQTKLQVDSNRQSALVNREALSVNRIVVLNIQELLKNIDNKLDRHDTKTQENRINR